MSTPRVNTAAEVIKELVSGAFFSQSPFVLADVGVSGGIADLWRQFEPSFTAFGFDPLVRECERLNAEERNARVKYFDGFIGYERYSELFPAAITQAPGTGWSNQPFERTSANRAQRMQPMAIAQWFNNANPDVVYSSKRFSLDTFFEGHPEVKVDFIKVDTDGHDYEVLCGANRILKEHQVLGLFVETQFHGISHNHANLFANIDRLLREAGFSLFDLETYRYTRDVLPGHFVYNMAAQTVEGQLLAGDALYLRDVAAPEYEQRWNVQLPLQKLLKLICLFELFGLPDCAAETLLRNRAQLDAHIPVQKFLDILARQIHSGSGGYEGINKRFNESVESFYPTSAERIRRAIPSRLRRSFSMLKRKILR